ncbi:MULTISPECIES: nuclear transport factor 2 family protein [unclassified Nocardia]|uniref:nuclear transport factor 2 family protein n=1 Tax=unclassified Nocardia TaxID=2637762 RepID=UPI001CE3B9E1|nr:MULTISPECIES: nuclear transport factor 2 family protein [unclassified Nocardia]
MTTEQTRETILAYIDALGKGDAAQLYSFFTSESTWTLFGELPTSRTWTGPEEIFEQFVAQMIGRMDMTKPVEQDVRTVLADGELALAEWTTRATAKSGEPYVNNVAIVFRLENGKIAEAREYFDTAYAGRVLFGVNA